MMLLMLDDASTLDEMATHRIHCAWCDADSNATVVWGAGSGDGGNAQRWLVCTHCKGGTIQVAAGGEQHPSPMAHRSVDHLPQDVDEAWAECRRAFGATAYTAAELM